MIYAILLPFFRALLWTLLQAMGRLRVTGRTHVPKAGPVIYCPNHVSDADPATVLVAIPRRAWFIGKSELFEPPFQNWLFRSLHGFPIRRDSADRAALRRAEEILKGGECLVLFPEGRCAPDGRLQRLQPGAALLSLRTGAPIVPVGLTATNQVLPYGALTPRRAKDRVTVTFGAPIRPEEFTSLPRPARLDALTARLTRDLSALTGQSANERLPAI